MGIAPNGIPYPEDTDLLAQGAQAIKAVVLKTGAVAAGTASLALPTANTQNTVAVTFPAGRFTAPPVVNVTRSTGIGSGSLPIFYWASGATTTGCNLSGISAAVGGAATIYWTAVQAP